MHDIGKKLPMLKLLYIITEWDMAREVEEILSGDGAMLFYQLMASGTAKTEMLDILGLGSTDKAVTLCLAPEHAAFRLMADAVRQLKMAAPGNGIAFITPLSGVSKPSSLILSEETIENISKKIEKDAERMKSESTHDLIIAIINQGYSEELMDSAREAGATGGTVIHARRLGSEMPAKFVGITLQDEKEMVLIIAEREKKLAIMKSVNSLCGLASEAQGIVFSLPVDAVMGM